MGNRRSSACHRELALHSNYPSQWPGVEGVGAWRVAPFRPQQGALAQRFHGDGRLGSLIPVAVRERDAVPHEGLWVQLTSGLVAQKRADLDAGTPARVHWFHATRAVAVAGTWGANRRRGLRLGSVREMPEFN
jgi:hypothetical protein